MVVAQPMQSSRLSKTLQGYNDAQKRLLAKNIGRFLYMSFQGQWDQDSAVQYACKVYGFNRQFPYDEMVYDASIAEAVQWLQARQPLRVASAAERATGDQRIRLLLELVIYYVHQPGRDSAQLDSAARYLSVARKAANNDFWKTECDAWQGELLYQQGQRAEGVRYFSDVANRFPRDVPSQRKAMAFHQWALHLSFADSLRLRYLEKAFQDYQQLGLKEQGIEVMSDIVTYCFIIDYQRALPKLAEVQALEQAIGYRHTMDNYYVRSFIDAVRSDYLSALRNADSCVAIMAATGDSLLYSLTCQQQGTVYEFLGQDSLSYVWLRKGVMKIDLEPREFWYKNFTVLTNYLAYDSAADKVLVWMQDIVARYPPQAGLDKIMVDFNTGYCYDKMGRLQDAEKYYTLALNAVASFPPEHVHNDILTFYFVTGRFYINQHQYKKARQLLEKGLTLSTGKGGVRFYQKTYGLLSRLDSLEGRYQDAYAHHQLFKMYSDSALNLAQRVQLQELNVRYATAQKDQDIRFLQQEGILNETALRQTRLTRNIVIGGLVLLAVIAALLYNLYRAKRKSAQLIAQKNKALEQLVDEKQWLLKEVHHRVKNSLQTVVSLLEMPMHSPQHDPLSAVQASQHRIYATSLLHQQLYQDESSSSVNMGVYLPQLLSYLQDAFETRQRIYFESTIAAIDLDISQAVPIGIIVNEVVTNAIKHAFPSQIPHPVIRVSLALMDDGMSELRIGDNGIGYAMEKASTQGSGGLGMELIFGLVEDINGTVQIVTNDGTSVIIRFAPRQELSRGYGGQG
jgi:two-component sensor histidine kinase